MTKSDLRLRLARSEAEATRLVAETMRGHGNENAASRALAGGLIISLGPGRYVNRMLCTGMHLDEGDIVAAADFFINRNVMPSLQISSAAGSTTIDLLTSVGFEVDWRRVVMAARVDGIRTLAAATGADVDVDVVHDPDMHEWLDVLARGNDALTPAARTTSDEHARAAHHVEGSIDLIARVDGIAAACGSLQQVDGIAWLGGAATVPEYRNRGLQAALLGARIDMARLDRCEYVAATALPDGTSARNLERAGLEIVDTQTVWTRK